MNDILSGFVKAFEKYEVFGLIVVCLGISLIAYTGITILKYMFNLLKKKETKHKVALILIFLTTTLYLREFRNDIDYSTYRHFLYNFLLYSSVSITLYMFIDNIIGYLKIGERLDSFLDSKGFKDKK